VQDPTWQPSVQPLPKVLLWAAAAVILVASLGHVLTTVPHQGGLGHVSGAWAALAVDLADGTFYRPLFSESGYGGTRFFPLHILLHGLLIRTGLSVLVAGHLIGMGAMLLLILGVHRFMRRLGVPNALAAPLSLLVLAPMTTQHALTAIRGDGLALALNIWGLASCATILLGSTRRSHIVIASLCFTLAFATKLTALYAGGAAVIALSLADRRKAAGWLAVLTGTGIALVLVGVHLSTAGRAMETIALCAPGGTSERFVLHAPIRLVTRALKADPLTLIYLLIAVVGSIGIRWREWKGLAPLVLAAAVMTLVTIMGSPGTDYNHFLDAVVCALVFMAAYVSSRDLPFGMVISAAIAAVIVMVGWTLPHQLIPRARGDEGREAVVELIRAESAAGRVILCESPLEPVLAGTRPYMLDSFMYRLISRRFPAAREQMDQHLEEGYFSAVILFSDPATEGGRARLTYVHFGRAFLDALLEHYRETARMGEYIIWRPQEP